MILRQSGFGSRQSRLRPESKQGKPGIDRLPTPDCQTKL
jgi:hypothetical protein